tara:strand:+ start:4874 stop:6277 length:1404 start_codon:yes stop_codon:yes gene_type:complete
MAITRTFTVTVVGGKYVIDGVSQATLTLAEGATYKFDQSDSTNGGHPLRFATAEDASGGTQYTTGVTSSGTPGNSGAYTQITVAASAPNLYYYCTNHSGMGGQANTVDADTWGVLTWGANSWASNTVTPSITGNEITSSQGDVDAFPEQGWGSDTWGTENWGASGLAVEVSGVSFSTALNADGVISSPNTGWGRDLWGEAPWGESSDPVIPVSGYSVSLGFNSSVTVTTEVNTGWGSDTWGSENWGSSGITVEISGVEFSSVIGENGWGTIAYGEGAWGEWVLIPADVVGLTGVSFGSALGTSSVQVDYTDAPSGYAVATEQGTGWTINTGADILVGLSSQTIGSGVGAITPADVVGITGVEFASSVGSITTGSVEIISVTGVSFASSVGSFTIADMAVGLTGQSFASSVGTITPADVVGLTGVEFSANVGELYPVYYKNVDIESSAGYEDVDIESTTTYTDVNIAA